MNERLARRLDVMLWHGGRWWMDQPRGYSHRRGYSRVAAGRCGTPLAMATPAIGTGQPLSVGMLGPSTGLPVVLYLRNDAIGLEAIEQLCRIPGVAGVKWASPTPLRLAEAIRRADPRIVWVGGLAETWAPPLCAVGARGFTSGLSTCGPSTRWRSMRRLPRATTPRRDR